MKKQLILAITLFATVFSFAQKKELKTLAKAVKNSNFAEAKAVLTQLEPMLSSMDDKSKAKYYLNKGKAFFANGAGSGADVMVAVESLGKITGSGLEGEVSNLKKLMEKDLLQDANTLFTNKNYKEAATAFYNLYEIVPTDLEYLYYAAYSAKNGEDYANGLKYYLKLKELGYTGVKTEYFATSKETGEEDVFDKETRDLYVNKLKTHVSPGERESESRVSEINNNIINFYNKQDNTDAALVVLKEARELDPQNIDLILSGANLYLKLKDDQKFKSLMQEAVKMQPNNAGLHYNIGVINMRNKDIDASIESFKKTLSIDPSYTDAALNISTAYIDKGNSLIEKMNALGNSSADNAKYDQLKTEKANYFQMGADILEAFISNNPKADAGIGQQLYNIYNALGNTDKANAVKSKFGL